MPLPSSRPASFRVTFVTGAQHDLCTACFDALKRRGVIDTPSGPIYRLLVVRTETPPDNASCRTCE